MWRSALIDVTLPDGNRLSVAADPETKRIVYAEAEDERVLRTVQEVLDEGLAQPVTLATDDLQEGLAAQRDKRKPNFKGR